MNEWRLLLIEDNPLISRTIKGWLPADLFNLEHRGTLKEGVSRLDEGEIDAVLLDLHLPDSLNAVDTLRVIAQYPLIPFIVMTSDEEVPPGATQIEGAHTFLLKKDLRRVSFVATLVKALGAQEARAKQAPLAEALSSLQQSIQALRDIQPETAPPPG